jgi:single-strand DNA-binding protein
VTGFQINYITLSGNLTRDPELRSTPSGTSVCSLGLANNTRRKDSATGEWVDKPNFFNLTVWGGMGEWVATNLVKGDPCTVSGRIEWRQYENRDGVKVTTYDVIVDSFVPGERREGGGGNWQEERDYAAQGGGSEVPTDSSDLRDQFTPEPERPVAAQGDDDIPF